MNDVLAARLQAFFDLANGVDLATVRANMRAAGLILQSDIVTAASFANAAAIRAELKTITGYDRESESRKSALNAALEIWSVFSEVVTPVAQPAPVVQPVFVAQPAIAQKHIRPGSRDISNAEHYRRFNCDWYEVD